jgi:hypothetical protein
VASITTSSGWAEESEESEMKGASVDVARVEGPGDMLGAREGKGGRGTGFEACDVA